MAKIDLLEGTLDLRDLSRGERHDSDIVDRLRQPRTTTIADVRQNA